MDNEFVDISTSLRLQLGFGFGHVLNDLCASLWFTYFLVYFHLVLEFTATQSGNLMLIGQVVDALATPFVGYHSDHTDNLLSAGYGKRKIWHLFGTVCVFASFPFIFSECISCSTTHKWAQMFYFASFIIIFQIGWAAVQISHLSLIPELSNDDHTRSQLTAVRYGFTVFSNLFVYIITWIILHTLGECDKQQVGPDDAWKFKHIVFIVLSLGVLASALFHILVTERNTRRHQQMVEQESSATHCEFLKKPVMYQASALPLPRLVVSKDVVKDGEHARPGILLTLKGCMLPEHCKVAGIYMSTRLVVNISQVLIPLYLHRTLGLAARALAVIPLTMYLGSLGAAGLQRLAPRSITRKFNYLVGAACALSGFVWIYLGSDEQYKVYFIYVVAVLVGFGGAVMLVTSLSLTADLVGTQTEASAFVYGLMSFTDKLACGLAIALIQMYAEGAASIYYRNALAWVCGGSAVTGLCLTLLLPKLKDEMVIPTDENSVNQAEEDMITPDYNT